MILAAERFHSRCCEQHNQSAAIYFQINEETQPHLWMVDALVWNMRGFFFLLSNIAFTSWQLRVSVAVSFCEQQNWFGILSKYLGLLQWLEVWIAKQIMNFLNGSGSHKSFESLESVLNPLPKRVGLLNFLFSSLGDDCVFLWELCGFGSRFLGRLNGIFCNEAMQNCHFDLYPHHSWDSGSC